MFFNPPKQATRNKQFQEIKKIVSFSHLSSKSLIKTPLQVFFEARSSKYLDIKKTGREPYRKLGRTWKEKYIEIWAYSRPWFWFLWKNSLHYLVLLENKNFHFHKPCYLASLTITNASLRSHESHTMSSFSFPFLNQIKLGQSWPSVSLLPSLLTQLCCSCL